MAYLRQKKSWMSFALWFQITFQNSFSVEIRQISLTHRHTTFSIVFFFLVLVRNSYSWWMWVCNLHFLYFTLTQIVSLSSSFNPSNAFSSLSWVWVHPFFHQQSTCILRLPNNFPSVLDYLCLHLVSLHPSGLVWHFFLPLPRKHGVRNELWKRKWGEEEVELAFVDFDHIADKSCALLGLK